MPPVLTPAPFPGIGDAVGQEDLDAAVAALVASAPATLDTLDELAAALSDDANFAAGVTTALAGKAADSAVVKLTGDQTVAGIKSFSSAPVVPAEAYAGGWDGKQEPAPKDAVWDALGAVTAAGKSMLTAADAAAQAALLTALAPLATAKGFVNHGATAGTARPSGYASVEWFGTVEPSNAVNGDTWNDPS